MALADAAAVHRALALRRAGRILSITHIGQYHMVLRKPADRPVSAVPRLCNVKTVTRNRPCPTLGRSGFVVYTCVCDSFGRILSITAVVWYYTVLRQPRHSCRGSVSRLRNVKTVTRSAPPPSCVVATETGNCHTEHTGHMMGGLKRTQITV